MLFREKCLYNGFYVMTTIAVSKDIEEKRIFFQNSKLFHLFTCHLCTCTGKINNEFNVNQLGNK